MKNEGARVVTTLQLYFRHSSAANSVIGSCVCKIIQLIQAFMRVRVTCKTEEDIFKNEGARVVIKDLSMYK